MRLNPFRRRLATQAAALVLCGLATGTLAQDNPPTPPAAASSGKTVMTATTNRAEATFGGGCFWCTEAVYESLKGVQQVVSGYSGGHVPNPTYEQVCTKKTGHAEVVRIVYDPGQVSFETLLDVFFQTHDPTTLNRQGNDVGPQYRSVVYYHDAAQQQATEQFIQKLSAARAFPSPIVTEVSPLTNFYPAENYHQNYFALNGQQPYCQMVVRPKVDKFRKVFADKLKTAPEQPEK